MMLQIWCLHWHLLMSNIETIFYLKELCVCTISKTYITLIHIEINNILILNTINIKEINNMNRNR